MLMRYHYFVTKRSFDGKVGIRGIDTLNLISQGVFSLHEEKS